MLPLFKKIRLSLLLAAALSLQGCLFDDALTVFANGEIVAISVGGASMDECVLVDANLGLYRCDFGFFGFPGLASDVQILTTTELLLRLILLDPMVLQLPAGASNFNGSYSHASGSGPLVITAGLSTVPIDLNRSLTAEPGTQLVIIALPAGAPTSGTFDFNFNFQPPPGATEVVVKPLFTGLVELANQTVYYPPLFPCVDDMGDVPAITIPIPVPGDLLQLPPLPALLSCDDETYVYTPPGGPTAPPATSVPLLGFWSLAALAIVLTVIGGAWLKYRWGKLSPDVSLFR